MLTTVDIRETYAQQINEQAAKGQEPYVIAPLKDAGFPDGAKITTVAIPDGDGSATTTNNGQFIVFSPAEDVGARVPITVTISVPGESTKSHTFLLKIEPPGTFTDEQLSVIGSQLLLLLVVSIFWKPDYRCSLVGESSRSGLKEGG